LTRQPGQLVEVVEDAHRLAPEGRDEGVCEDPGMAEPTVPDRQQIRRAPKVLLHDHLDGGLRPGTVLELAGDVGHPLPAQDAESLARWFAESADSGSLERYLETFDHTVAVMQTAPALERVARECVADLAADGVVYAEIRYAPEQHVGDGLSLDDVVGAVRSGFEAGMVDAGGRIVVRQLLTAMRHQARSREIAELAVAWRDAGVVGFDIAGAEAGFPPTRHLDAFEYLQRQNFHFTIHAGEAFGLPSIWEAIQWCGADRLGHGVRIIDDISVDDHGVPHLGRLAAYVRDKRIPLEMAPASNVQTGAAPSIGEHPIGLLTELRFRVTVNTDNRLMSRTSMTDEMLALVDAFGYGLERLRWFTINAMKSSFLPFDERLAIIDEVIKPGYAALGAA
jgi:adenosine deaminase